jgi:hypothetical protein
MKETKDSGLDCNHAAPALAFDPEKYCAYLADFNLTPTQQTEFLEAVWAILVAFVDIGFRIHPVQQAVHLTRGGENMAPDLGAVLASTEAFTKTMSKDDRERPGAPRRGGS